VLDLLVGGDGPHSAGPHDPVPGRARLCPACDTGGSVGDRSGAL